MAEGPTYRLTSHGNGWAYTLSHKDLLHRDEDDWPAVWVQDEMAYAFREDWAMLEHRHPNYSQDRILQMLWTNYSPEHLA